VTDAIEALLDSATGFDWDAGNAPKVQARHQVEPGECEQAFFVEPFIVAADAPHAQQEARWYALGRTFADRYLFLVFTMRGSLIRVVSARPMNRKERRVYVQAQTRREGDPAR
jgi:uncharacterized DUF497 family protein